jgi:hypothetical protein
VGLSFPKEFGSAVGAVFLGPPRQGEGAQCGLHVQ